jgi:hypothetical protein
MRTQHVVFEVSSRKTTDQRGPRVLLFVHPRDPWKDTCEFVTAKEARRMAALLVAAAERVERMSP